MVVHMYATCPTSLSILASAVSLQELVGMPRVHVALVRVHEKTTASQSECALTVLAEGDPGPRSGSSARNQDAVEEEES